MQKRMKLRTIIISFLIKLVVVPIFLIVVSIPVMLLLTFLRFVGGSHDSANDIYMIEDKKYLKSKIITLKGKKYQELILISGSIMQSDIIYAEIINGELDVVKDWETYYALRVKYAICVLSMHGVLMMDYTLALNEDEFVIQNGKLVILNETKRAIFDTYTKKYSDKSLSENSVARYSSENQ